MTRAAVSRSWPQAHGVCDRCGARYLHKDLQFQFQWTGPKLQNLRILVCRTCLDVPQPQLRTIVLPPDPVPIENPRPEQYTSDMNPNSGIGQSASPLLSGSNIGTLIGGGGTYSAFDGNANKPFARSAYLNVSTAGLTNWVGKQWGFDAGTGATTNLALVATGFTVTAPNNAPFLASGATPYEFQGSNDGSAWTTLASGNTAGTVNEAVTNNNLGGTSYQYHRFALTGDGTAVALAQLAINTNRGTDIL